MSLRNVFILYGLATFIIFIGITEDNFSTTPIEENNSREVSQKLVEKAYRKIEEKDIYKTDLTNCKLELQNVITGKSVARDKKGKSSCFGDRHSSIMSPSEAEEFYKDYDVKHFGLGIVIAHNKNRETVILMVTESSDAYGVLRRGDVIYAVRGVSSATIILPENNEFLRFVKKESSRTLFIKVRRDGILTDEFKIVMKENIYPFVFAKNFKGPQIGYVHVRDFGEGVDSEFKDALQLFDANYRGEHLGVIVDLRGNPGGLLNETLEMIYLFAKDKGDLALEMRYSHEESEELRSERRGQFSHFRIVVLIDEGSASASEVFAGVLKDWSRGDNFILVGKTSYGKGVGQSRVPLPDGFFLRITSFEFFVGKSGVKIHHVGVSPHYVVEDGRETLLATATSEDPQFVFACRLLSEYPDKCMEIK